MRVCYTSSAILTMFPLILAACQPPLCAGQLTLIMILKIIIRYHVTHLTDVIIYAAHGF